MIKTTVSSVTVLVVLVGAAVVIEGHMQVSGQTGKVVVVIGRQSSQCVSKAFMELTPPHVWNMFPEQGRLHSPGLRSSWEGATFPHQQLEPFCTPAYLKFVDCIKYVQRQRQQPKTKTPAGIPEVCRLAALNAMLPCIGGGVHVEA